MNFKKVISGISLLAAVAGIWFGLEMKFASAKDLENSEQKTVQTMQLMQQQLKIDISSMKRQIKVNNCNHRIQTLTDQKYQIRDLIRKHPKDTELKEDLYKINNDLCNLQNELNNF